MINWRIFKKIKWSIEYEPSIKNVYYKDSDKNIKEILFNQIIFDFESEQKYYIEQDKDYDQEITMVLPLGYELNFYDEIKISKIQTIKSFLEIIYEYYQSQIKPDIFARAFHNNEELLDAVIYKNENNLLSIKNINSFGIVDIGYNFIGIDKDDNIPNKFCVVLESK